jgi:predicted metalloprotease
MRWRGKRKSSNVEDRRNMRVSGLGGLGGRGGGMLHLLPVVFKFLGFKGTAVLALCVVGYGLYTGNIGSMLAAVGLQQGTTISTSTEPLQETAEEKELVDFVSVVLADTEETWHTLFREKGKTYKEPRLVLFRDSVKSACGMAQAAMGPFYCPGDQQVYIDLGFYDQLKSRYKAPGDFAQAYVIAHEVGHHIQTLVGTSGKVRTARKKLNEVEGNKLSVLQELQADCLAGIWANHANNSRQLLEAGDVEEGLAAASAIGDDTLQKQSRGYVTPDSFTHGSSAQRVKWFKIGLASGDMDSCDTFNNLNVEAASSSSLPKLAAMPTGKGSSDILTAFENQRSDVQVRGKGIVSRLLPDDNEGSRHQKFILKLANRQTVLVAHNIDLAPRIPDLTTGDSIEYYGEYEWNEKGGLLHWTHDDPAGRHEDGWLKHKGKIYQ